jgi:hypothetical protein
MLRRVKRAGSSGVCRGVDQAGASCDWLGGRMCPWTAASGHGRRTNSTLVYALVTNATCASTPQILILAGEVAGQTTGLSLFLSVMRPL